VRWNAQAGRSDDGRDRVGTPGILARFAPEAAVSTLGFGLPILLGWTTRPF
jgi:hypothetical protein